MAKFGQKWSILWRNLPKNGEFYVKKSGSTEKCYFFERTFRLSVLLSTGALFASNDSKTSFEQRKNAR
jgi:hypothetical protein